MYEYLLDNLEVVALDTFSSATKIAEDMKNAALELKVGVKATLEGDEDQRIRKERIGWEESLKKEEQLIKEQEAEEEKSESRRRKLELQEDEATAQIGDMGFMKELINAVTGKAVYINAAEKKAETIKKSRLKAEQAIRKKRLEAIGRMSDFTAQIKQCKTEENMAVDCTPLRSWSFQTSISCHEPGCTVLGADSIPL